MFLRFAGAMLVIAMTGACSADSGDQPPASSSVSDEAISARIEQAFPGIEVTSVDDGPVAGLKAVMINGVEVVHVSEDGTFLFTGDVYELRDTGPVDLNDKRFEAVRKAGIGKIDPATMITFKAEQEQTELWVFTDVSCGYCRRLHQQMSEYNELGITIHYLAYPRGGMNNAVADTMRAVWCASDRVDAITQAKLAGASATPPSDCQDPVAAQFELGRQFGVKGTPAMFTRDGVQLGGYVPPPELAKRLNLK